MPASPVKRIFSLADATADGLVNDSNATSYQIQYTTAGFSGTLDFQTSMNYAGPFTNSSYAIMATGAITHSVAQVSHTTNSATWHIVVQAGMPFLKVVMTRSAGTITMDVRGIDGALNLPAIA